MRPSPSIRANGIVESRKRDEDDRPPETDGEATMLLDCPYPAGGTSRTEKELLTPLRADRPAGGGPRRRSAPFGLQGKALAGYPAHQSAGRTRVFKGLPFLCRARNIKDL